jgi:glycosyltransferase involved in cell wall biosynthesis
MYIEVNMAIRVLNVMLGTGKGGLEASFVHYTRTFKEMGYVSAVLCHKKSPYIKELEKDENILIYKTTAGLFNPIVWWQFFKAIRSFKPDVLCLQGNRAIKFGTAKLLKKLIKPYPVTMATTHNARNKLFYKLDGMYAITKYLKNNLVNDFKIDEKKVFECSHAVSYPPKRYTYNVHAPLTFGFLGRLEPVKGGDVLLKACLKLKEKHLPFRVLFAGDGALFDEYKSFVSQKELVENVEFLGWINDKDKFFEEVDVLCLPSRSEAQSLTLLEGLSYAKPSIVSACPGMVEVVSTKNSGLIFEIENADELAEKMTYLIENPDECVILSDRAYQSFVEYYNIDVQKKNLAYGIEETLRSKQK